MKSGTTSLHNYLNTHPDISMSTLKEINYFSDDNLYLKGSCWYEEHFTENKIIGESSQSYSRKDEFPETAKRLYEYNPEAKIIYIIRDPWERLLSQYKEYQSAGDAPADLNKYLLSDIVNNDYVRCSCYGAQIDEYLKYFKLSQLYILTLENLIGQPSLELSNIFRFLNVDSNHLIFKIEHKVYNASVKKRRPNCFYRFLFLTSFFTVFKRIVPKALFDFLKSNKHLFDTITLSELKEPKIDESVKHQIQSIFHEDLKLLNSLTSLNIKFAN